MKLNRKLIRKMILKEMAGMGGTMDPSHPDYEVVGQVIMNSAMDISRTKPGVIQFIKFGMGHSVYNDIAPICEKHCMDYGVEQHCSYVIDKVMEKLAHMG